jgi:competence protein ComEA
VPELSRSQIAVYGAVCIALLLVGVRAIRSQGSDAKAQAPAYSGGSSSGGSGGGGSFHVSAEGGRDVVVHVAGAVRRPDVYRLPDGARVIDAVERAGGGTPRASLDSVNLAARLADGQQIVVPERGPAGTAVSAGAGDQGPISLGSATLEQLDSIEGIGPVTAQKILEFRDQHGGLSSVDQLDQVSGIGPATMQALRGRLQP